MKRIFLLILTNVLVVVVLGIAASLLGVNHYLTRSGLNLGLLLGYALLIGFGGAFISLLISKPMAKWSSGVHVITEPQNADEAWIVQPCVSCPRKPASACPRSAFLRASPMRLPRARFEIQRWWPSPPACWPA